MRFHVGPWTYRLRIAMGKIFDDGAECWAATVEQDREILISADCPVASRLLVLTRELFRAWIFASGTPTDAEGWADLSATMVAALLRDLPINGGAEAIQSLMPGESPAEGAARIALTRTRYCGICQASVAGGSVECHPSKLPGILDMSLYCEGCGHVQRWQEMATATGLPSGAVVGEPRYERPNGPDEFPERRAG